jgi:hypothetical protein
VFEIKRKKLVKIKYLLVVVCCLVLTQTVSAESKSKRNICEDVGLSNPLLGLCNGYLNVDCRDNLKHGTPQCIALRKNFLLRSGGKNIDEILNITSPVSDNQRVFNAKVTPDTFFINESSSAIISAEIASGNLYLSSVVAYETDAGGNLLTELGPMYDDGSHGDARAADTVFTMQLDANKTEDNPMYVRVLATYEQDVNRYLSPVMKIDFLKHMPYEVFLNGSKTLKAIEALYLERLAEMSPQRAREMAYREARHNPDIQEVRLHGVYLSILFKGGTNGFRGSVRLDEPGTPIDGAGNSIPAVLPENYKNLGNDKLLIFAPGYNDIERQNKIADEAKNRFDNSEYTFFDPKPSEIVVGQNASLELIKHWGDYGVVVLHAHGGIWEKADGSLEVTIQSGTPGTPENYQIYEADIQAMHIEASQSNMLTIYPSFISKYGSTMKNTFFYLGACDSLANNTMWDALAAKGAKVVFGWSDTVSRSFNEDKFKELIEAMLPTDFSTDLLTAKEAYDSISDKVDGWCLFADVCIGGNALFDGGATLTLKTATPEWNNFILYEGGIINGDFETGDWTGWIHGGDYDSRLISSAKLHQGDHSAALGRWDTVFHGEDSAAEPYGYEWFYQDFVVPENVTYLKFFWWMETYDTAVWDWFDAYIQDTNGNTLKTILSQAGKPGNVYGPYWTTEGWQEVAVDVSAYRGQKIRIYFDQRLDGYGDQQRVYIDDVKLE